MANQRLIVVLGMHRSGTSTVARAMQTMNVSLGDKLMPAVAGDNPKGFFEDTDIYALNVEMLHALQIDWFSLVPVEPPDVERLRAGGYFLRAVDLLKSKTAGDALFAFKDPRIAKLLPFWSAVFKHCHFDVSCVVAVRNPRSVAKSLAQRNGFDLDRGYLLWLEHVIRILTFAQDGRFVYVDYDSLVESPLPQLRRLAKALGLDINARELERYKAEFLDGKLRHTVFTGEDLEVDAACPPLVREMYAELRRLAETAGATNSHPSQDRLDQWVREFGRVKAMLAYVDKLVVQESARDQTLKKLNEQVETLTAETVARGHWGLGLDKTVAERDATIAGLQQQLRDLEVRSLAAQAEQAHSMQLADSERQARLSDVNQALFKANEELRTADEARHQLVMDGVQTEREIGREHAARLEASQQEIHVLQKELQQLDARWVEKSEAQQQMAARERATLLGRIESARASLQQVESEARQLAADFAVRERDLLQLHGANQRELTERLEAVRAEARETDRRWSERWLARDAAFVRERDSLLSRIDAAKHSLQIAEAEHQQLDTQAGLHAAELNRQLSALQNTLDDQTSELVAVGQTHQAALADLGSQLAEAIRAGQRSQERESELLRQLASLQSEASSRTVELQLAWQTHRAELQAARKTHLTELQLAQQTHRAEMQLAQETRQAEMQRAHETHEADLQATQQAHRSEVAILELQIAEALRSAKEWRLYGEAAQQQLASMSSHALWRLTEPLRWVGERLGLAAPLQVYMNPPAISGPNFPDAFMTEQRMPKSRSTNRLPNDVTELLRLYDEPFIHAAYQTVLRRNPDQAGLDYYLDRLRKGVAKLEILSQLRRSKEGRAQVRSLPGMDVAIEQFQAGKGSGLKAFFMRGQHAESRMLNALENHLHRSAELDATRHESLTLALAELRENTTRQAQTAVAAADIAKYGYEGFDAWGAAEALIKQDGLEFIEELFALALGRRTQEHEASHHMHLLRMNVSKLHLINLLLSSEECQRWQHRGQASSISPTVSEAPNLLLAGSGISHQIRFDACEKPTVSVVIPVHGKVNYTLTCLQSVQRHLPAIAFEIIVVDDKSPDNTLAELAMVQGIRVHANDTNLGFIRSCNAGARMAKGSYICFLNNDTEVQTGWLDELARTFHDLPGTGLVGSKLLYPDGTLQEAGGIIWQDGSAWNFGRNQDASLPVYNYAREVDYCSGASIMILKALFEELGGFDEHYLPAYCEDSDLALKVRSRGLRVIYQPLSEVVHYEGITSGTDTTQGAKAYQIENSKKLFERWQSVLKNHQPGGIDVDKAKDRAASRRVLVLDHCTPTPNEDAGSVTVFNTLVLLREMGFQVTFIAEDNLLYLPDHTRSLQRAGIEVLYAPHITSVAGHLQELGSRYDLVLMFRPGVVERHLSAVRFHCAGAKVLFHTVDLHYLRMSRQAELLSDAHLQQAADHMKERECQAIRSVDATIVHSTAELELLRLELKSEKIHVFPLILDTPGSSHAFSDRKDLVFIGGYQHTPNVDAVKYFVEHVMPLLRVRLPGLRFFAVGSKPPAEVSALASEDVVVTGFVEELAPLLAMMRVSVAPLRFGAGIKGKIGTSMALGLPVVATSLAVEGMSLTDGKNILVADGDEELAAAVVRLYEDEALWNRLGRNGLSFAEQTWGAEAAWRNLADIVVELGMPVSRGTRKLVLFGGHPSAPTSALTSDEVLVPIASVTTRSEYEIALRREEFGQLRLLSQRLLAAAESEAFSVPGQCVPCSRSVDFLVDMKSGGQHQDGKWLPNWRERMECPSCNMNNRQRLMAALVKQRLTVLPQGRSNVYFMEQVTPIIRWAQEAFPSHHIVGSEYLGHEYRGGDVVNGIRHEDVMDLSFPDGSLDLIVSNDVFEHVPSPAKAFRECARVLRQGGLMLATIPFHAKQDRTVVRATLTAEGVHNILEPMFHGNPVSADGSLVFTDFGWDVLHDIRTAGFSDVRVSVYASEQFGHLGGGEIVFEAGK